jgi:hypothetical protein
MRRAGAIAGVLWLSCAGIGASQSKPDFSGTWTRTDVTTTPPETMVITQDATTMMVAYRGGQTEPQRFVLKLDGSPSSVTIRGPQMQDTERIAKAAWEGDRLVMSFDVSSAKDGPSTIKTTWSLDAGSLGMEIAQVNQTTGTTLGSSKMTFRKEAKSS